MSNVRHEKIAVVIPCFNEAEGIAEVIKGFPHDTLAHQGLELQVFVVDNNSTDDTARVAKDAGATVITEREKGKGNALRKGFQSLPDDIDYVAMLDGDNTYSPGEILRLIEPLQSDFCDVVIGSRLGGNIQDAAMSRLNYVGNKLFTGSARLLYGANMTDVLTGYFAWKKSALDELSPHIVSSGFAIEMEMITKMARLGHRVTSVPISYTPRAGESNLHPLRDGSRILVMLLRNLTWLPAISKDNTQAISAKNKNVLKIVFVSDSIYPYMKGGKEKRLHEITKHLADMGHEVHIYTMHWWNDPAKTITEHGVHLHAISKYHQMYNGDHRTIKEGIFFGFACLRLFKVSFDVLDVDHMPFFPIFSSWIVCVLRRKKMHATWHEVLSYREWIAYMGIIGIIAAVIERISVQLPYKITAASIHTQSMLTRVHGRRRRIETVESGIDTFLINEVAPKTEDCDVLFVGRLVKDKNVDKLIEAIANIKKTRPKVKCVIIGQGPERQRLDNKIRRMKLRKHITILDPLPNAADVYGYMKAAKVFCSPSVREGFGIVTLEALGCGVPVVTIDSAQNAARHLVEEGKNGSIVPLDAEDIAAAVLYWMSAKTGSIATNVADRDWRALAQRQAEVYSL